MTLLTRFPVAVSIPATNTIRPSRREMARLRCTKLWTATNNFLLHRETEYNSIQEWLVAELSKTDPNVRKKITVRMRHTMEIVQPM